MSFFGTASSLNFDSLAAYAQTAVSQVANQVEKRIDRALDISESDNSEAKAQATVRAAASTTSKKGAPKPQSSDAAHAQAGTAAGATAGAEEDDTPGSLLSSLLKPVSSIMGSTATTPTSTSTDAPPQPQSSSSPLALPEEDLFAPLPTSSPSKQQQQQQQQQSPQRKGGPTRLKRVATPSSSTTSSSSTPVTPKKSSATSPPPAAAAAAPFDTAALDDDIQASSTASKPATPPPTLPHVRQTDDAFEEVALMTAAVEPEAQQQPPQELEQQPEPVQTEQQPRPKIEEIVREPAPLPQEQQLALQQTAQQQLQPDSNLMERLAQRERQILTLTQENAALNQTMSTMRGQLEEFEISKSSAQGELDELKQEVLKRMSDYDKKLQSVTKERDTWRSKVEDGSSNFSTLLQQKEDEIKEKDEQIQQLLAEGEKLSKEQLKNGQQVKKLKQSVKDAEAKATTVQAQLDESTGKIAHLQDELKLAERYKESGVKVQQLSETQAKRVADLEQQLQESKTNESTIQANLQRAWTELSEMRKANAESVASAQSEALTKEIHKSEELHAQLETTKREAEERESGLRHEILDLRTTLTRMEDMAGWREDNLRQEIANTQAKLQASEARLEEVRSTAEDAAKPLLRQIETLQSQMLANSRNWATVEQSLTAQVQRTIDERSEAVEKERVTSLRFLDASARLTTLESQVATNREERSRLVTELELARSKVEELERRVVDSESRLDAQRQSHVIALQENKTSFQALLRSQLQDEKALWERKMEDVERRLKDAQHVREQILSMTATAASNASASAAASAPAAKKDSANVLDMFPRGAFSPSNINGDGPNGSANLLSLDDRLSGALKAKTAEAETLTEQLIALRGERDGLAEELLRITRTMQQTEQMAARVPAMEVAIDELNKRYMATLELLGEKTEEAEELRDDLKDVKAIFRDQVNELLARIEKLQPQQPSSNKSNAS